MKKKGLKFLLLIIIFTIISQLFFNRKKNIKILNNRVFFSDTNFIFNDNSFENKAYKNFLNKTISKEKTIEKINESKDIIKKVTYKSKILAISQPDIAIIVLEDFFKNINFFDSTIIQPLFELGCLYYSTNNYDSAICQLEKVNKLIYDKDSYYYYNSLLLLYEIKNKLLHKELLKKSKEINDILDNLSKTHHGQLNKFEKFNLIDKKFKIYLQLLDHKNLLENYNLLKKMVNEYEKDGSFSKERIHSLKIYLNKIVINE